jgi:hypothetical protein
MRRDSFTVPDSRRPYLIVEVRKLMLAESDLEATIDFAEKLSRLLQAETPGLPGRTACLKEWQALFDTPTAEKWRDWILDEVYHSVTAYRGLAKKGELAAESAKEFVEIVEAMCERARLAGYERESQNTLEWLHE